MKWQMHSLKKEKKKRLLPAEFNEPYHKEKVENVLRL